MKPAISSKVSVANRETLKINVPCLKKNRGTLITAVIVILVISFFVWQIAKAPKIDDAGIISKDGLHWHATLEIKIKDKAEPIPAEIGLGAVHNPIHTHDLDNVIHMEFAGLVTKDDLKLGKFFEAWDKQFNQNCIFENCSGPDGSLKMLVNGEPNIEFENYHMKDDDKIEIIFD